MVVVSASLSGLLEKLASLRFSGFSFGHKRTDALFEQLQSTLLSVQALMHDAEEKQIENSSVKVWLRRLEDVFYDADDLLDEISYDAIKRDLEAASKTSKSWASIFGSASAQRYGKGIRSKMERIFAEIEQIAAERARFHLIEGTVSVSSDSVSTSFVDESVIVGREKDKTEIVSRLLQSDDASASVEAIGIIGMVGLGKTTLAQLAFNDNTVQKHFDLRAWVCVSDLYDIRKIMKTILEYATLGTSDFSDLNVLQSELSKRLSGRRFLLVLDDAWTENYRDWEILKAPLLSGARGSKILVTTRSVFVASVVPCSINYFLDLLGENDCWAIFAGYAFAGRGGKSEIERLEDIGKRIVQKCGGLPLAVKAIAGVLRLKRSREEWLQVLNSTPWELDVVGDLLPSLRLSYNHLPPFLKQCFAYCSMFPKDNKFDKEKLVLLWMAQGFLQQSHGATMEEVGFEYFDSLLKRSFFQQSGDLYITMHDLMHDLAQSVSERLCSILDLDYGMESAITNRTRHLLMIGKLDTPEKFWVIDQAKSLRTFFLINTSPDQLSPHLLKDLPVRQQQLRALSLPHCQITELPTAIGNLKHLRYLDLSHSALKRLPESLGTLYFLQTLILTNCSSLTMLPEGIVNLVNLRHLHIKGTGLLQMPEEMGRLTSLQTLTNFIVGWGGSQIKELGTLIDLRTLSLSELQNVSSASDASKACLNAKRYLNELQLEWSSISNDPTKEIEILRNLEPCKELKNLTIRYYGGIEFPSWLGDSFSNIVFLHLSDSNNCSSLPPLGQLPSLEHLIIERISGVTSIGHEFYSEDKPFQHLKRLKFEGMSRWEQWISPELEEGFEFPCLEELYIQNCPNLEGGLPESLPSLLKLEISNCQQLNAQLPKVPDSCKVKLYDCDQVQHRNEKMPLRSYDEVASQLSSTVADEISIHSYGGFSRSSSSLSKNLHDDPSTSKMSEIRKVADKHDDQIQTVSSEDGKQQFLSFASFKVSSITQLMDLPPDLLSLRIESCDALDSLPSGIKDRSFEELYIIDCISFKNFPQGHLTTSLKTLYIRNCRNLEFPQPKILNQFIILEDLCLGSSCDHLKSFPLNSLPNLKTLSLWDCKNLESLSIEKELQIDIKSLDALEIRDCPNLTTFPKEGLQALSLTSLVLSKCSKLKSLPRWMQSLISLQSLHINRCPELESLPSRGLPSSLNILCITFCDKITPQRAWELDKLDSLGHFEIEGGCKGLLSFPEDGLLPTNLKSLRISRLSNLKCLDENGLQQLTSLQTLEINCCNELRSLPEDGLPYSLSFLRITDCSLLNQKLQKRKGKEWLKIAHIASIHVDE
ncbi:PREDICTED: putative disease resistance RPP13-like protein 1 [Theobroma cacao]|uniref:Disease resistance RPP13-like protein 1 n=1 Tax=Theobroma cacao TaxID=3641 RepID=A0AB32X288_THECC|nr:PREDICTED: putative disease resistance RPP13-like protein 1 [Theobroma cacao]XP_017984644.1 PREDICTED: putative disease resistance RPP13-like protein 1 [Theobroma cacao]